MRDQTLAHSPASVRTLIMSETAPLQTNGTPPEPSFVDELLLPGSSRHPTFLLLVDGAFAALLAILLALFFVTSSYHFVALILLELGLWGSVKWRVQPMPSKLYT